MFIFHYFKVTVRQNLIWWPHILKVPYNNYWFAVLREYFRWKLLVLYFCTKKPGLLLMISFLKIEVVQIGEIITLGKTKSHLFCTITWMTSRNIPFQHRTCSRKLRNWLTQFRDRFLIMSLNMYWIDANVYSFPAGLIIAIGIGAILGVILGLVFLVVVLICKRRR